MHVPFPVQTSVLHLAITSTIMGDCQMVCWNQDIVCAIPLISNNTTQWKVSLISFRLDQLIAIRVAIEFSSWVVGSLFWGICFDPFTIRYSFWLQEDSLGPSVHFPDFRVPVLLKKKFFFVLVYVERTLDSCSLFLKERCGIHEFQSLLWLCWRKVGKVLVYLLLSVRLGGHWRLLDNLLTLFSGSEWR